MLVSFAGYSSLAVTCTPWELVEALLPFRISTDKSDDILIGLPLYVIWSFLLKLIFLWFYTLGALITVCYGSFFSNHISLVFVMLLVILWASLSLYWGYFLVCFVNFCLYLGFFSFLYTHYSCAWNFCGFPDCLNVHACFLFVFKILRLFKRLKTYFPTLSSISEILFSIFNLLVRISSKEGSCFYLFWYLKCFISNVILV